MCILCTWNQEGGGGGLQKPTFHLGQMVLEKLIYFKQAKERIKRPCVCLINMYEVLTYL